MSSILSSSFDKNVERVGSKSHSESTERTTNIDDSKTQSSFARVLGDLQKQDGASPSHQASPHQHTSPLAECPATQKTLSNLTVDEQIGTISLDARTAKPSIMSPVVVLPQANEIPVQTVSRNMPNTAMPQQIREVTAQIPEVPELINARTVRIGKSTGLPAARISADSTTPPPNLPSSIKPRNKIDELRAIIQDASQSHGIDPNLSFAVAKAESSLRVYAVSQDGHASKGLFQLLDTTAREMLARTGRKGQKYDPFNPKQNSDLGNAYLRRLHDLFGKVSNLGWNLTTVPASSAGDLEKLAVAAFNAGEGRVARAQARARAAGKNPGEFDAVEPYLPASTQQYVQRVLGFREELVAASDRISSHTETV